MCGFQLAPQTDWILNLDKLKLVLEMVYYKYVRKKNTKENILKIVTENEVIIHEILAILRHIESLTTHF